ncbi:MAG: XRE family transcriptional regulator [Gammaproteobacteria bacterium]|nr:XRE family transcriptional regulator [Gammaproteobacteria bacterium]
MLQEIIKKENVIITNITQLMQLHNISEAELARRTSIPQTTINRLLTKGLDAKTNTLKPIANLFNVTVSHLIGEIPLDFRNINYYINSDYKTWSSIPIIPWDQVTNWRFAQSNVNPSKYKFIVTEKSLSNGSFGIFTRPFMQPLFREDAILIIDPKKELLDGAYVLLSFNHEDATIRQINFDGSKIFIKHPIRTAELPIELDNTINIHGLIIECRINMDTELK